MSLRSSVLTGELVGSDVERMTRDFLWVILLSVAMPWGYFFYGLLWQELPSFKSPENSQVQV
jgi:hypothetical protein